MAETSGGTTGSEQAAPNGFDSWQAYWTAQGMPWRTEPDIDEQRQHYLAARRMVQPDIKQGLYPFKDIKLDRADIEWLLATHESGRGPVGREEQRPGPDLRGANLRDANLSWLPLSCMLGGLGRIRGMPDEGVPQMMAWPYYIESLRAAIVAALRRPTPRKIGKLIWGGLAYVMRRPAGGDIDWLPALASIQGSTLPVQYEAAAVHLEGAKLIGAQLDGAVLREAHLEQALLPLAHLEAATLKGAHLRGAMLSGAHLGRAHLARADLCGAILDKADLQGANLEDSYLDAATSVVQVSLYGRTDGPAALADIHWGDANITTLDWAHIPMLGEERRARQRKAADKAKKDRPTRMEEYQRAVRANRQLATCLRSQGLQEDGDRFAYRAQKLHRIVLRRQHKYLRYLGSLLLGLISGYGYRPLRSVATYVLVVLAFAGAYLLNAQFAAPHLRWDEAIVLSISAFHGRGFFTSGISLGDTLARLAAGEAILGLLIEITFIATFTQRFFAR
jgi:uncharacterized protein YjbI with pentapeptide repeats